MAKTYTIRVETKPSGLWCLEYDDFLYCILAPAMEIAKRHGLVIEGWFLNGAELTVLVRGPKYMIKSFWAQLGAHIKEALAILTPEVVYTGLWEALSVIDTLPFWITESVAEADTQVQRPNSEPTPSQQTRQDYRAASP